MYSGAAVSDARLQLRAILDPRFFLSGFVSSFFCHSRGLPHVAAATVRPLLARSTFGVRCVFASLSIVAALPKSDARTRTHSQNFAKPINRHSTFLIRPRRRSLVRRLVVRIIIFLKIVKKKVLTVLGVFFKKGVPT
jgi:hypothetical protein